MITDELREHVEGRTTPWEAIMGKLDAWTKGRIFVGFMLSMFLIGVSYGVFVMGLR